MSNNADENQKFGEKVSFQQFFLCILFNQYLIFYSLSG